jgi:hypothetical protein
VPEWAGGGGVISNVANKPRWKVVLRKEARLRREVLDTSDVFITTTMESIGLISSDEVPSSPEKSSLIEAAELSEANNLLAIAKF